jgi:type II secretory pathway pseudopilin PulG
MCPAAPRRRAGLADKTPHAAPAARKQTTGARSTISNVWCGFAATSAERACARPRPQFQPDAPTMTRAVQRLAFSIYELVIVLAIVAVLAGMAVPRLSTATTRYRADAAGLRLCADLNMARKQAKQTSSEQEVEFDVGGDSYKLVGIRGLNDPTAEYVVSLADEPYNATITAADFAGDPDFAFNGYGTPLGIEGSAGIVVITVGDEIRTVVVDGDTGEVAMLNIGWAIGDALDPNDLVIGKGDLPVFDK